MRGILDNKHSSDRTPRYWKHVRMSDCKTRLHVVREAVDGPWVFTCFHKEHNHELVPPKQTY